MDKSEDEETGMLHELDRDITRLSAMADRIWRQWLKKSYRRTGIERYWSISYMYEHIIAVSLDIESKAQMVRKEVVKRMMLKVFSLREESMESNKRKEVTLSDLERKKHFAKLIKEQMKMYNIGILHPVTGNHCTIQVISSPDGKGRYVLEELGTRKRTYTSRSLADLPPVRLEELPATQEP